LFIEIVFDFVRQNFDMRVFVLFRFCYIDRIDDERSGALHLFDGCRHQAIYLTAESEKLSSDPNTRAAQPVGIEETCVIGKRFPFALTSRRIYWIDSCDGA